MCKSPLQIPSIEIQFSLTFLTHCVMRAEVPQCFSKPKNQLLLNHTCHIYIRRQRSSILFHPATSSTCALIIDILMALLFPTSKWETEGVEGHSAVWRTLTNLHWAPSWLWAAFLIGSKSLVEWDAKLLILERRGKHCMFNSIHHTFLSEMHDFI